MTSPILSVSLFGAFEARLGERPFTTFGNIKAQALLIYLLIEGNKQHAREALMTLLWPDAPLKAAQVNFRQVLARIRKTIPESGGQPLLLSDRKTVSLNPEARYEVDVLTFERLSGNQPSLTQQPSVDQMAEAAALYRGDFLADFYLPDSNQFEEWVAAKRPYYRQQALATLDSLATHFLEQQDYRQAQTYTWQQLEIDPLRERACQQLMTALARTGQRSSALAEYDRFRQLLWDELGVEPSQETAVLHQQIQNDEIRAVEPAKVPKKSSQPPRNNLPTQPTPFIGREDELAQLQLYLNDSEQRLVSIVGPGGMGKTRLALALAEHNLANGNSFANGIFFVNLAPLSEPDQILSALADAFNFQLAGGSQDPRPPEQQILDYLREKKLLLLMDNFEHLLDGVDLLNGILEFAPNVQILVTSRERLHLHQEQVYSIQGLEFPDWETPEDAVRYTAVQLFLQSAQRNQADFALGEDNDLTYLARICRLVAGMPLAIELAAAWVDTLSLADIATEIQESLDFLETEMRDMPERHRSIRASINYSWQKLNEKERNVFAACSVFRGGFTQKAGRAITGASLRTFSRLVNKSFLQFDQTNKRYQVHELMRQFGAEVLAEDDERETAVRDQHSTYYLQALANRTEELKGAGAKEAYKEITADYLNAYRAWHWGVQRHHFEQLEGALISLRLHTYIYSIREFKAAVNSAIAALENSELTTPQQLFLARLWVMHSYVGNTIKERQEALVKGQSLLDDLAESGLDLRTVTAEFLRSSAVKAWGIGRYDDASQLYKESLSLYQKLNDKWYQARMLTKLGHMSSIQGQKRVALSYYQQSLSLRKSIGDELGVISNSRMLIANSLIEGNNKHYRETLMQHLEIAHEFGDYRTQPNILSNISYTFLYDGRPEEALKYYLEGLGIVEDMGYVGGVPRAFADIADALMRLDNMKEAEPYIHKGLQLAKTFISSNRINIFLYRRSLLYLDKGLYDLALEDAQLAYSNSKKEGHAITLTTVAIWLAWLHFIRGYYEEAERLIFISLSKCLDESIGALELTAYLLVRHDTRPETLKYAWQLIALLERFPIFKTFLPVQKLAKQYRPSTLSATPPAEIEVAKAKGRELEWEAVIDELLEKLPKLGWYITDEGTPQEKSSVTIRNNLPTQPTRFIGREAELARLQTHLDDNEQRLITIVGPGGMGKTRLALALAEQNLAGGSNFANGIFFVNLAPLNEPGQMVSALADAFNFQLGGGSQDPRPPKQQILDYLREKHLLLLMDNFEHLLDGVDLLNEILDVAPNVQILATSRERLHLHQEQVYPIQGLEFPDWETPEDAVRYTAVQLFLQSAQRNQADFTLGDGDDLTYLARICRLVAGMPLAIELAAAWVDTLSLADIATEIQENFDFLETEIRDMPERHRSIRASINSSWQKLAEKERDVFAASSVFRGGFTQKAGRAVTGASLRTFSRLVNKSFLQFDQTNKRYHVHELMRQFGAEILAEDEERETAVRDQHSTYYLQALANRTEDLKGPRAKEAYQEITADYLNAYRAWHWGVERHHFEQLDGALLSLWLHTNIHSSREFTAALKSAIAALENSELTTTRQLFLVRLWIRLSYLGDSIDIRQEALAKGQTLLDDLAESGLDLRVDIAEALRTSAFLAYGEGRYEEASHLFKECLTLYQKLKDKWYQARILLKLGQIAKIQGQVKVAETYYQQSLSLRRAIGDELGVNSSLRLLTTLSIVDGNYEHNREMMKQQLEIAREFGDHQTVSRILSYIGDTFLYEARPEEALKYHLEALAIVEEMGFEKVVPMVFADIASALLHLNNLEEAEPYIHKGLRLAKTFGESFTINELLYYRSILHLDKGDYDLALEDVHVAFSSAKAGGGAGMLVYFAIWLAWLHVIKGNYEEAERLTFISLTKRVGDSIGALELTAYLLVRRDPQPENLRYAWQLIALFEEFPIFSTFLPIQKLARQFKPTALSTMPPAEIEAAKAKGRELEWEAVIDDLLEKLPKLGWNIADEAVPHFQENDETAASKRPEPARLNEQFVTEKLFATGGHGQVYLGRDVTSGQQVIIKKLKPELAIQQPDYIARFIQEGEALRQLNHPNIVKMLATIENEDEHLIVMEYVAGGSLRDLLDKTPQLPLTQALNIGLELADALSRAHHLNIIHRDLKPSNVLLAADGTPRLTDFGIAYLTNQATRITKDNALLGTIRYMSPEACEGEVLDGRSDIWSFGVILYEMLAGQIPFAGETTTATLIAILNDPAPLLAELRPDIPLAFVTLIERMLVKEREGRIDSVRKVAAELESIQNRTV